MLLLSKIVNKKEVSKELRDIIDTPNGTSSSNRLSTFNINHFSCKLCFRFLEDPIRHNSCSFNCRDCLREWAKHFKFCNHCKEELTEEEVDNMESNKKLWRVIQLIRIKCSLGKCGKGSTSDLNQVVSSMPMIMEKTIDFDIINFSQRYSLNASLHIIPYTPSPNQQDNLTLSDCLANSLGHLSFDRRLFSTIDYTFHLNRKHFWPILNREFVYDKKRKIGSLSFAGFKKGKKYGPGVVHYVNSKKEIGYHRGPFVNDIIDKEGIFFFNKKMIYDGKIKKGIKEGLGTQRCYFSCVPNVNDSYFLEYRGYFTNGKKNGMGKLYFVGDYFAVKQYFEGIRNNLLISSVDSIKDKFDIEDFLEKLGSMEVTCKSETNGEFDLSEFFDDIIEPLNGENQSLRLYLEKCPHSIYLIYQGRQ